MIIEYMKTSITYASLVSSEAGYNLSFVLEQQYYYDVLDNPKSRIQYDMYKADLKIQEAIHNFSKAVGEAYAVILKSISELANKITLQIKELNEQMRKNASCNNNKVEFNKFYRASKRMTVERYLKSKNIDMRGVIKRNVRDHRY